MSTTQSKRLSCALGGALPTIQSIYRVAPILHCGPGCGCQLDFAQRYGGGWQGSSFLGISAVPSTNTLEREVVFGGEGRLKEIITSTREVIDADAYVVLTGCTSAIIGDDIASVIKEFGDTKEPLAYVEVSGFKGNTYQGYDLVWEALVDQLTEQQPTVAGSVNLFGVVPTQDIYWQGNLKEIARLLQGLGLKVRTFLTGREGLDSIRAAGSAELNIILSPYLGEGLEKLFQRKFGIPSLRYPGAPVGPTATSDFLTQVAEALRIKPQKLSKLLASENSETYDLYTQAGTVFLGFQFQERVAIVGDSATAIGLTRFLAEDLSQLPVAVVITDEPPESRRDEIEAAAGTFTYADPPAVHFETDQAEIDNAVRAAGPSFVLGSSQDKSLAKEIGAAHLGVTFPSIDRLVLSKTYAGFRGSVSFIEDYVGTRYGAH